MFAIRQKSTGWWLPGGMHRNTWRDPSPDALPRLFRQRPAAKGALTSWLKGRWEQQLETDWETGHVEAGPLAIIPIPERKAEDMEIVEVRIVDV